MFAKWDDNMSILYWASKLKYKLGELLFHTICDTRNCKFNAIDISV